MYRQLYMGGGIGSLDAGAPSIKYTGNIDSQMASAPDPMDALNDLAMQLFGKPLDLLTPDERQALDEYNSGMMAVGGRVNYGIGSKLKKLAKNVIDPIAQVAAFIPGVHQPFAQGYTALRASGVGGDNYGGLQVLGITPGAGQLQPYGTYGMPGQGGFRIQDFIPTFDATGAQGPIFDSKGQIRGPYSKPTKIEQIAEGIKSIINDDSFYFPSKKELDERFPGKKDPSIPETVKKILLDTALGKDRDDGLRRGTSAYLAKKAYDDQVRYNELLKKQYEDYIAATGAARTKFADKSKLKGYEVTGVPRTARDVVRAPVMGGGIMNTRKGYNMGSVGAGLGAGLESLFQDTTGTPGFEGLFQDTIGTTMVGPNIEDEIMRRVRKYMQMTDDVDAAYKMAEMEFMSELESKYPGFYEEIGTLPQDLNEKDYRGRLGYAGGTIDKDYEAWKRMYEKSEDAAEGLNPIKHQEYIQRYEQEKNNRTKYAIGGDTSEPISSFEQNTMMAGPDWYVKRVEILMELGYDYETASEIAFDSNLYDDAVGGMNKGGRPGYALGDTATMAAQVEGLPLRNNQAGITELDLRDSGGFIPPVGIKEKADDIPAMLSNNEFVFTADAVRGMGDGDVDVGAQRMYNIMKKLEKGGRV